MSRHTRHTPELEFDLRKEQRVIELERARKRLAVCKFLTENVACRDYSVLCLAAERAIPELAAQEKLQVLGMTIMLNYATLC